jgi:predicted esterase
VAVLKYTTLPLGTILPLKVAAHISGHSHVSAPASLPEAAVKHQSHLQQQQRRRILCLHGYGQTAQSFRARTGSLRKAMKWVDFDFVDAPHLASSFIKEQTPEQHQRAEARGWWNSADSEPSSAKVCVGIEASLVFLADKITTDGPYDGVLAFSQGATMAALASLLLKKNDLPWRFAILIGGFEPMDNSILAKLPALPSSLPTLHVLGTTDAFVPKAKTVALASRFVSPEFYNHSGGHGLPSAGQFRSAVKEFIVAHC